MKRCLPSYRFVHSLVGVSKLPLQCRATEPLLVATTACQLASKDSHASSPWNHRQGCLYHSSLPRNERWRASQPSPIGVRDLKKDWLLQPDLEPHIRACLASLESDDPELDKRDTGFSVILLGTGAGKPSLTQSNAATALRMGSTVYLFDAGEGVQLQLMRSRLRTGDIQKIFITHLHGDHIFGLPGLLLALQSMNKDKARAKKQSVVQIYGPVGLYNYIAMSLSLSCSELRHVTVEVYELMGGSPRQKHPGGVRSFGEFRHRSLVRKSIPQNEDGTWTLETATEITTPEQAVELNSSPRGVHVTAAEVQHLPKMQCFGYVVREPFTKPRNIDVDKAAAAGIAAGKDFKIVKSGFPVMNSDGTREVHPDEVLVGNMNYSRSLVLLGDCCAISSPMARIAHGADVLIHEATLTDKDKGDKADYGGHSTPSMAGLFADHIQAKVLLLNHLSPTSRFVAAERALAREAEEKIRGPTKVQIGYDHLELLVPWEGYPW